MVWFGLVTFELVAVIIPPFLTCLSRLLVAISYFFLLHKSLRWLALVSQYRATSCEGSELGGCGGEED